MTLVFKPWNPGAGVTLGKLRLLVVAESHYEEPGCVEPFGPDETTKIVRGNAPGFVKAQESTLFTKIADLLADERAGVDRDQVWRRICYYNYFQRPFKKSSDPPTRQDYADGLDAFDTVLVELQPSAVLVMSSRLWRNMKNDAKQDETYAGDGEGLESVYRFSAKRGLRTPAAYTWHPSARRRFVVEEWRPRVQHFLSWVLDTDGAYKAR